jgi:predicted esterase
MFVPVLQALLLVQAITPGKVIPDVRCEKNTSQGYALYLPSDYSADRPWPVLFAFDPRARGVTAVERFAAGAEKYGWIVAGSNNSHNGDADSSLQSLRAMSEDVFAHYPINSKRIYAGGMSGGARIAMQFAIGNEQFTGVIAASAAYPDNKERKSLRFPVFGTAGVDDFNWREMYELDQTLTSPHRVVVFEGGHVWLPVELATEAIGWMELHAMRTGLRPKDPAWIAKELSERTSKAQAAPAGKPAWEAIKNIGVDFAGLADEAPEFTARARKMEREKAVQDAIKRERNEFHRERQLTMELWNSERGLKEPEKRQEAMTSLRDRLESLVKQANASQDSSDRRIARRVTRNVAASGGFEPVKDPQYQQLLEKLQLRGPRR